MKIEMKHGAGGEEMQNFIKNEIASFFENDGFEVGLAELDDAGVADNVVVTTDSYTVKPIFFPGGNIGKLAVSGTVNDIYAIGGKAKVMTSSFIIEDGFDMEDFRKIVRSMAEMLKFSGTKIITGDTKVVEHGSADGIFINTAGFGERHPMLDENFEVVESYRDINKRWLVDSNIEDGDIIISTGYIGDHGVAILAARYEIETEAKSDCLPLNRIMDAALKEGGVIAAKDPTRGGVANLINEWREKSKIGFLIEEEKIPVRDEVKSVCEILGIDYMELGNEGKYILAVVPEKAEDVLEAIRKLPEGKNAEIIGRATSKYEYAVLATEAGGKRIIEQPSRDAVPRIC